MWPELCETIWSLGRLSSAIPFFLNILSRIDAIFAFPSCSIADLSVFRRDLLFECPGDFEAMFGDFVA